MTKICVLFSIAAMYMLVGTTLVDFPSLEKSLAESGSGFHLLSCPKLFEKHATMIAADIRSKYSNILDDSLCDLVELIANSRNPQRFLEETCRSC
jgi:hypothetical protein